MNILLRTEGLTKTFTLHLQGGTCIPVLGRVDLAVSAGECVPFPALRVPGNPR